MDEEEIGQIIGLINNALHLARNTPSNDEQRPLLDNVVKDLESALENIDLLEGRA